MTHEKQRKQRIPQAWRLRNWKQKMPQATRVSGTSTWLWNGCWRILLSLGEIPALWPLQGSPMDVIDNVGNADGNDDLDDKNHDSVDDNDQDARKGVIRMLWYCWWCRWQCRWQCQWSRCQPSDHCRGVSRQLLGHVPLVQPSQRGSLPQSDRSEWDWRLFSGVPSLLWGASYKVILKRDFHTRRSVTKFQFNLSSDMATTQQHF